MGLGTAELEALVQEYARAAAALYPRGLAWNTNPDSTLWQLLEAQGDSFAAVHERAVDLLDEADPRTTTELVSGWERVLGLPDPCDVLGQSIPVRRAAIVAKLTGNFGQSIAAFEELAESLGWDAASITITEPTMFRVGVGAMGDALYGTAWVFAWKVTAPVVNPSFARAGSAAAGDRLAVVDNDLLRCFLEELKPAHTVVVVDFSDDYTGYAPWPHLYPGAAELELVAPSPQS